MAAGGVGLEEAVPDTLDAVPPGLVAVEYPGGLKLETGAVLTPTQVKDVPTVGWGGEEGALYTLMLIDPDAPSRADPKFRHWLHWLVANIPGSRVGEGEQLFEYISSGPPPETGLHRYVFLALKQSGKLEYEGQRSSGTQVEGRLGWDHRAFIAKHSLVPVAANLYRAEWDEYVPKLYEILKVVL